MDQRTTSSTQPSSIVGSVKQRATAQIDSQKGRATEGLAALAQAARQTTQQLRSDQHDTVAQYIDRAAEQLERISHAIQQKDANELLRDAQAFARRQPALFIGWSFVAGMLVARFLKSSPQDGSDRGVEMSTGTYGSGTGTYASGGYPADDYSTGGTGAIRGGGTASERF